MRSSKKYLPFSGPQMFAVYTFPLVCIATRPIDVENGGAILDLLVHTPQKEV